MTKIFYNVPQMNELELFIDKNCYLRIPDTGPQIGLALDIYNPTQEDHSIGWLTRT